MSYKTIIIGLLMATQSAIAGNIEIISNLEKMMSEDYQQFHSKSQQAQSVLSHFCETPSQDTLKQAQNSWLNSFEAHQRVKIYNFGPYYDLDYDWKFQFWPDKRGRIPRTLTKILKNDIEQINFDLIDQGTVLTKGYPALEVLLFGHPSSFYLTAEGKKYCHTALTINKVITTNIERLSIDYAEFKNTFNKVIDGDKELEKVLMNNLAESIIFGVDTVRKSKLGLPLGLKSKNKLKPMKAEAWRSQKSYQLAIASYEQSIKLWLKSGITALHDSSKEKVRELSLVNADIEKARLLLKKQKTSLFTQVQSDLTAKPAKEIFNALNLPVRDLKYSVSVMGFTIGFNNQDGD